MTSLSIAEGSAQTSVVGKDGEDYSPSSVTSVGQTPIADWYRAPSAVNSRPSVASKGLDASQLRAIRRRTRVSGDDEHEEDWSQSVLLAADLEGRWPVQRPGRA